MRLIDADALIEKLQEAVAHKGMGAAIAGILIRYIEKLPTIEAEPVRHGEWRIFRDGCVLLAECPECGTVQSGIAAAQWDYCPMCGAKMDGAADDADALLDRR